MTGFAMLFWSMLAVIGYMVLFVIFALCVFAFIVACKEIWRAFKQAIKK